MNKYKDDILNMIINNKEKIDTRLGEDICIRERRFNLLSQEVVSYFMPIISNLEAKVYTYEKIIANSNFKAILEDNETKKNLKEVNKL